MSAIGNLSQYLLFKYLPVRGGGTGTGVPSLVAGTNVTVTGAWPNQTVSATAGGSGNVSNVGTPTNGQVGVWTGATSLEGLNQLPVSAGGTGTGSPALVAGANVTVTGTWPNQTIAASSGGAAPAQPTEFSTNSSTSSSTSLAAADINVVAAFGHTLSMTGAITVASNAQLPTVAALVAAWGAGSPVVVGQTYSFRVINTGGTGAGAWTITTNTGWTLHGTMTVLVGNWRDFIITFTSLSAATLQTIGGNSGI